MTVEEHGRIVETMIQEHRVELAKMELQLALYRGALEEAGIEPPDRAGAELLQMWRDASAVVRTTADFTARLGSAKELIGDRLGASL